MVNIYHTKSQRAKNMSGNLNIIAHRGLWNITKIANRQSSDLQKQFTLKAYENAFQKGFGAEADITLSNGILVVNHPSDETKSFELETLLRLREKYKTTEKPLPLMLHLQSSGIAIHLKKLLDSISKDDPFILGFGYDYAPQNYTMNQGILMLSTLSPTARDADFLYKPTADNTDLVLCTPDEIKPAGIYVEHSPQGFVNWNLVQYMADIGKHVLFCAVEFDKPTGQILKQIRARGLDKNPNVHVMTNNPEKTAAFFGIKRPIEAKPLKMNPVLFSKNTSR